MKRLLLLVLALLAGCDKGASPPAPPVPPPAAPAPAAPPVPLDAPVQLSASANGSVQTTVSTDWPVVLEVTVFLKPDAAPFTLANPAGPWSDGLRLECIGPGGADRASVFTPAFASNKSIDLTHDRSGLKVWILDGSGAATLPEGTWKIRVVVDETKVGNVLPAGLASNPITLVVTAPAANPSAGAAQRKCLAVMTAFSWKNDPAKALAAAATHLAAHPDDVAVLFMNGQTLRAQGEKAQALRAFIAALDAAKRTGKKSDENFGTEDAIAGLQREMAGK